MHDAGSNTINVYVVADADGLVANDRAVYAVVAQPALVGGATITSDDSGSADVAGLVQNVFADGTGDVDETNAADTDFNGRHSDTGVFAVQAADLTVTKTSTVVWDPVSCAASLPTAPTDGGECTADNPKAIPGAYIEYTITIVNAGNSAASNVTLTDALTDELDDFDFVTDAYNDYEADGNLLADDCINDPCGILITVDGGTPVPHSNGTGELFGADDSDWDNTTANTVTSGLNGGTIAAGQTKVLQFRVAIK